MFTVLGLLWTISDFDLIRGFCLKLFEHCSDFQFVCYSVKLEIAACVFGLWMRRLEFGSVSFLVWLKLLPFRLDRRNCTSGFSGSSKKGLGWPRLISLPICRFDFYVYACFLMFFYFCVLCLPCVILSIEILFLLAFPPSNRF